MRLGLSLCMSVLVPGLAFAPVPLTFSVPVLVPGLPVLVLMLVPVVVLLPAPVLVLVQVRVVGLAHLCVAREIKTRLKGSQEKNQSSVFYYPGAELDYLHKLLWSKKIMDIKLKVRKIFHTQENFPTPKSFKNVMFSAPYSG